MTSRWSYVNGRYSRHTSRAISIEDRGFQFSDGVYEVCAVHHGHVIALEAHLSRLKQSLESVQMTCPVSWRALPIIMDELIIRNHIDNGSLYLQITRGVSVRAFKFPVGVKGSLVMMIRPLVTFGDPKHVENGITVLTIPDIRWKRRDIKSISLLPQVLGKQQAAQAGCFEAWQVDDQGTITEGCASNAWIVTNSGCLVTRPASTEILNGVTRVALLSLIESLGYRLEIRPFCIKEAYRAQEAFCTNSSMFVIPIVGIDEHVIGTGKPGPITMTLRNAYIKAEVESAMRAS